MKRLALVALLLGSTLAAAQPTYLDYKMLASQQNRFPVYADTRSNSPAGLDKTLMENAVHRAWDTWNAVQCALPKVQWMGGSSGTVQNPPDFNDSYSVTPVWMLTNDQDAAEIFGNTQLVMAITIPRSYAGVLQTCDVYFNAFAHSWSVAPTPPVDSADVETVALHEAGHCLGLNHYGYGVMDQVVEKGEAVRALLQADVANLCGRYPLVGESGSPCFADGGCQQTDLKCVLQPQTNGITTSLCTRGCSTGANTQCDLPFTCQASTTFSGFNGACLLPGSTVTAVGRDCLMNPDCGNSVGYCQRPLPASAGQNFWVDGYCTQDCAPGQPACPSGSVCITLGIGERCLQSCRVGLADCRADYACAQIDSIGTSGVCVPRCYTNLDCAPNFNCRTCDGLCVAVQNPVGEIGNPCLMDSECGSGQVCRITSRLSPQKQCVEQCSRGCGACRTGSTCTPMENGELFCLRDCAGPGSCGPALRCADTQVGRSCLPACAREADCPVGQSCDLVTGECVTPMEYDGGCSTLQCRPDAGRPIVVVPKDAGTGNGGTGGCGCASVDPSFGFALLGLVTLISRRRSWRVL